MSHNNRTWNSPFTNLESPKRSKKSSLRIATIVSERMKRGLCFEGMLLPINRNNWKHVLNYTSPDFLIVEDTEICGLHRMDIGSDRIMGSDQLISITILTAKQRAVPTVLWITQSHECYDAFINFAFKFDLVCCCDPIALTTFASHGIKAELLLPCFQPSLYNPFRNLELSDISDLGILFDGWADLSSFTAISSSLYNLKKFGLNVIESRSDQLKKQLLIVPGYDENILGFTSMTGRAIALKYSKAYATHGITLSSTIEQQWMTLEAAASRLPIVHYGSLAVDDIRKEFVIECTSELDYNLEFMRFNEDDLYRERVAHLGWRNVNQKHTFSHRLQSICRSLNIEHDWNEFPMVSVITPTFRRDHLKRIINTYDSFNYPNKELILVLNDNSMPVPTDLPIIIDRVDIKIINVPNENFAGAALNYGHMYATGEYCFRVDDDDYYGSNYIYDMINYARCIGSIIFGKPPVPIVFEGETSAYARKDSYPLTMIDIKLLIDGSVWLGGNTISGAKEFFAKNPYCDRSYGAADTAMILSACSSQDASASFMDCFNLVAERRNDGSSHTWKVDKSQITKSRLKYDNYFDLFI